MNKLFITAVAVVAIIVIALSAIIYMPQLWGKHTPEATPTPVISNSPLSQHPVVRLLCDNGTTIPINVEIADSFTEREYGLMNRQEMAANEGMLFIFDSDSPQTFWMKDTLIPLDIIFIKKDLTIVNIKNNATPMSEDHIYSSGPCRYVLEVNGGLCDVYGIGAGDRVRLDIYE